MMSDFLPRSRRSSEAFAAAAPFVNKNAPTYALKSKQPVELDSAAKENVNRHFGKFWNIVAPQ